MAPTPGFQCPGVKSWGWRWVKSLLEDILWLLKDLEGEAYRVLNDTFKGLLEDGGEAVRELFLGQLVRDANDCLVIFEGKEVGV